MFEVGKSPQPTYHHQLDHIRPKVRRSHAGGSAALSLDPDVAAAAAFHKLLEPLSKSATVWGFAWLLLVTGATADATLNGAGRQSSSQPNG